MVTLETVGVEVHVGPRYKITFLCEQRFEEYDGLPNWSAEIIREGVNYTLDLNIPQALLDDHNKNCPATNHNCRTIAARVGQ